jgi:prolyl-tRNA synthetase
MLPLGQRVQEKLEKLIDKHMQQVGALKVSLSSISSQALWEKTGRLAGYGPELFRFTDRKDTGYLLAPTHEEEITSFFSSHLSYKNLPLRVYQIGRKYRDELRPRHGLLRSREFTMKDLYTFDMDVETALQTYSEVRAAYSRLFDELKLPYLVAEASSGDIGGDLSHEYHLPSSVGEDNVISCDSCSYVANEELAVSKARSADDDQAKPLVHGSWYGITKDRSTLVVVDFMTPADVPISSINTHAVKAIVPDLDPSIDDARSWVQSQDKGSSNLKTICLVDQSCDFGSKEGKTSSGSTKEAIKCHPKTGKPLNLLQIQDGDGCAQCASGKLRVQKAVELGHTFHLGTRYSEPLNAKVRLRENVIVPMQMGCHGIGVSRIIGAVADLLADKRGLNWPRAMAPYEVIVIPGRQANEEDADLVYDHLDKHGADGSRQELDVVLDDRPETFAWKMKDADVVGYPIIVLLGRRWADERVCEVQCRRLSVKEDVPFDELPLYIDNLLSQL